MFFVETENRLIPKCLVSTRLFFVETKYISASTNIYPWPWTSFKMLCFMKSISLSKPNAPNGLTYQQNLL